MKIRPVETELFHADGQRDRQTDMTKLISAFRNCVNSPKNRLTAARSITFLLEFRLSAFLDSIGSLGSSTAFIATRNFRKNIYIGFSSEQRFYFSIRVTMRGIFKHVSGNCVPIIRRIPCLRDTRVFNTLYR